MRIKKLIEKGKKISDIGKEIVLKVLTGEASKGYKKRKKRQNNELFV